MVHAIWILWLVTGLALLWVQLNRRFATGYLNGYFLSEGIGVKILEVVNSAAGLKPTVVLRISRKSNQLSQLEASRCN